GDGILEKNNINFSLELILPDNDYYLEVLARRIELDLGEIGLQIRLIKVSPEDLRSRIRQNDFELALDHSVFYPLDLVRTFYNFFDMNNNIIQRNRVGQYDSEAVRSLNRTAQFLIQDDAVEIFRRLQDIYRETSTSEYLTYQHHQYYAINTRVISDFAPLNILISPGLWKPAADRDRQ
ncbi:hypothetical protein ACFL6G_10045, partial [candidate division KSB1 bacterium]